MTHGQLQRFVSYLIKRGYMVWVPKKQKDAVVYSAIKDATKLKLVKEPPLHSFKRFLVPPEETLFEYKKDKLTPLHFPLYKGGVEWGYQAIFGMNPIDLKALVILNHIFEKDPWYQERMKKTLVIGQSLIPNNVEQNIFHIKYEEDILEHLQFDIFLEVQRGKYFVYTGSEEGQKILDEFGYRNYEHIQFAGPIREEGLDPQMIKYREALKKIYKKEVWEDDLGARCIECGKCTLICPTCFCFDIKDQPNLIDGSGVRKRTWSACFYNDFSEIAGGHKFLRTTAERIHFWYYHKFVRIPDQFQIIGCVGCGRCVKVCPVNINIFKVLASL